jgi:predicted ATPase/DNA-binding CsgD family transcriptional regulator
MRSPLPLLAHRLTVGCRCAVGSGGSPGKLRGELTEFVGRRAELALIREALGVTRLVTLTGPGGIGKTRLALRAADHARRAFRDGVRLAELGGLRDPALLVAEVARSLGLSDQSARWAVASLSDHLRDRQLLLVLDQCEHLADACAVMADGLLRACPGLRIIATSRHVLGVTGEVTVAVPPMTVPAGIDPDGMADLLRFEAVGLFVARAAAVLPGFTLDVGNAAAVAGICRRLDGIPLALELAAVRLRSLSPAQILSRLDTRFQLLSSGSAAEMPQHRTLEATLEWSYGLLTAAEQALWRRVSVFAGSFDLDAAEVVCAGGEIAAETVVDLVDTLVAKSVLSRGGDDRTARYRLLDTIGEFGLRKVRGRGNERRLRLQHRRWYAALAARQEWFGPGRAAWIAALGTDHENLRTALEFSISEPGEAAAGAEMACDLWRYWETHGHLTEGRRILATLLDRLDHSAEVRPRTLWVAGFLALVQGDLPGARALLEAGLSAARVAGDARAVAYASGYLGYVMYYRGQPDRGNALAEMALRMHQESGDQIGVAMSLTQLGSTHLHGGELTSAAERFAECARVCERSGNVWYQTYAQRGLGVATWLLGDPEGAATLVRAALRATREIDHPIGIALCLDALAWITASQANAGQAATLLGAADAAWAAIPAALSPALRGHHDAARAAAREALPENAYQAASAKGMAMGQAEAIAFALGEPSRPAPRRNGRQAGPSAMHLTRREQDVAILVARGMSNSKIASELVISARTVESHVQHIMDKLGFSSRAQIAVWSAARPPAPGTPGSGRLATESAEPGSSGDLPAGR